MKITDITTRLVAVEAGEWYGTAPLPLGEQTTWEFPLVTISTDEGVEGHTMAYGKQQEGMAIAQLLQDVYRPRILGENPLHSEAIWHALRRKTRDLRNVTDAMLGMIDVALWDIKGKIADLPIAELLGVRRTTVPSYATASRFLTTPDLVHAEAMRVKEQGYQGYKLQIWDGPALDIPRLRAAREAVGPDFALMHDAIGGYRFTEALEVGRALGDLGYTWFEEPVPDQQIGLLTRLSAELQVPILAAENLDLDEMPEYLSRHALDLARGDVHHKAGVTGLRKATAMCELFGVDLEIHTASTPLLDIANLHVACAMDNSRFVESHQSVFRFGLRGRPLDIDSDGCLRMPDGPGLGVELDWDWLDNHTTAVV